MLAELDKLEANLGGVAEMRKQPDAVFIVDLRKEQLAVREARRLGLPVVALVDTNCDPDEADYVIPGNDDAIRSCLVITKVVADAVQEGQYLAYQGMQTRTFEPEFEQEPAASGLQAEPVEERRPIRLSEEEAAFFGAELEEVPGGDGGEPAAATTDTGIPADTSADWAAPSNPSDVEADTIPSERGASDPEALEREMDRQPLEPAEDEGGGAA